MRVKTTLNDFKFDGYEIKSLTKDTEYVYIDFSPTEEHIKESIKQIEEGKNKMIIFHIKCKYSRAMGELESYFEEIEQNRIRKYNRRLTDERRRIVNKIRKERYINKYIK
jgi:hypothetical protein